MKILIHLIQFKRVAFFCLSVASVVLVGAQAQAYKGAVVQTDSRFAYVKGRCFSKQSQFQIYRFAVKNLVSAVDHYKESTRFFSDRLPGIWEERKKELMDVEKQRKSFETDMRFLDRIAASELARNDDNAKENIFKKIKQNAVPRVILGTIGLDGSIKRLGLSGGGSMSLMIAVIGHCETVVDKNTAKVVDENVLDLEWGTFLNTSVGFDKVSMGSGKLRWGFGGVWESEHEQINSISDLSSGGLSYTRVGILSKKIVSVNKFFNIGWLSNGKDGGFPYAIVGRSSLRDQGESIRLTGFISVKTVMKALLNKYALEAQKIIKNNNIDSSVSIDRKGGKLLITLENDSQKDKSSKKN